VNGQRRGAAVAETVQATGRELASSDGCTKSHVS
jgi:hypothetical protein